MYAWRHLTPAQRDEVISFRKREQRPWHSPPHRNSDVTDTYLFTAACYEHLPIIGHSLTRMATFEQNLCRTAREHGSELLAWAVLPNHYHFLARTTDTFRLLAALGRLHGRTAYDWNGEDNTRGRKVWHSAAETAMKSEGHFLATINYVHHNPIKHGWATQWQDWPFSSAADFLKTLDRAEAERLWREYPIDRYGEGWDEM